MQWTVKRRTPDACSLRSLAPVAPHFPTIDLKVRPDGRDEQSMNQTSLIGADEIKAYFEWVLEKTEFLLQLHDDGREGEALLLCSAYLEALGAKLYWPEERSHYNFVKLLSDHGNSPIFAKVHTLQLKNWLAKSSSRWSTEVLPKVGHVLQEMETTVHSRDQIMSVLTTHLSSDKYQKVQQNLWHGTVASICYETIRCEAVHGIEASSIYFDTTTYNGNALPDLNFDLLYKELVHVLGYLRNHSLNSGKLFGHSVT